MKVLKPLLVDGKGHFETGWQIWNDCASFAVRFSVKRFDEDNLRKYKFWANYLDLRQNILRWCAEVIRSLSSQKMKDRIL